MKEKKGQVLLLVALLSATLLAVAGAIFFESFVQTKVTKIQEESIRALKAAEGLAEEALNQGGGTVLLDPAQVNLPGAKGEAKVAATQENPFTTPLLAEDEQYTFYFYDYDSSGDSPGSGIRPNMKIYPEKSGYCTSNPFVVEVTFVNISTGDYERKIVGCSGVISASVTSFDTSFQPSANYHLAIFRIIAKNTSFPGVRLKVERSGGSWPAQGKKIVSTVKTGSGITKTVEVFQSYPQIPASFFVTKF